MTIENKAWKPNKWIMFKTLEQDIAERETLRDLIRPYKDRINFLWRRISSYKCKLKTKEVK